MMAEADALPPQVTLSCGPVDPASVPPPPNPIVNGTLFRLEVAPADGNNLRGRVDLRITYPPDAVPSTDRSKLVLGYLDGSTWTIQPDQTAEPSNNTISAKVDRAGVYALYPRP